MRVRGLMYVLTAAMLLAGCGGAAEGRGQVPEEPLVAPTATTEAQPTATAEPPTEEPTPLPMGEALFRTELRIGFASNACSYCHAASEFEVYGPSLSTMAANAADRVEGMSAEEYTRQSILDPGAFFAGEFAYPMPEGYGGILTEAQVDSLIAYILE